MHFHSSLTSSSCCIKFQQRCTNTSKKALPLFFLFEVWANCLGNFKVASHAYSANTSTHTHTHTCVCVHTDWASVRYADAALFWQRVAWFPICSIATRWWAASQWAAAATPLAAVQATHTHTHTSWWQRQEIVNNSKPRCLRVISPFALGVVAFAVARTSCYRSVISMPHTLLSLYVCVGVC